MQEVIDIKWSVKTPQGILNDMRRPYILWKTRAHKQRVMSMKRKQLAYFLRKERKEAELKESRQTLGEWLKGRKHV